MAVVVSKRGVKVKANGKYHSLGETISGLSETEEKRLAEGGTCKYVPSVFIPHDSISDVQIPNETKAPEILKEAKSVKGPGKAKGVKEQIGDNESGPDTSHPSV